VLGDPEDGVALVEDTDFVAPESFDAEALEDDVPLDALVLDEPLEESEDELDFSDG
jgi:hypothetical protein